MFRPEDIERASRALSACKQVSDLTTETHNEANDFAYFVSVVDPIFRECLHVHFPKLADSGATTDEICSTVDAVQQLMFQVHHQMQYPRLMRWFEKLEDRDLD